jgi:glyoxalase family protein
MSTGPAIPGLHHTTAITGRAADNVAFYTQVLGMRLVKKTVNQDDVSAYHLFYGDETGSPGTEVTFFDWPDASPNVPGAGTVARISLAVPDRDALAWWRARFRSLGVRHGETEDRRGRAALTFADPEGQRLELVDAAGADLAARPWARSPVPAEVAIRGMYGVTLEIADAAPTLALMTGLMGFRRTDGYEGPDGASVTLLETGAGGPGTEVRVVVPPSARRGVPGTGGVHHVAFRAPDRPTHRAWLGRLQDAGVRCTPVVDRYYFQSIYFREPGGVLFEIATDGPGFATDEPVERLGERLALPPFLEPMRARIEAGLRPLDTPGAGAGAGFRQL